GLYKYEDNTLKTVINTYFSEKNLWEVGETINLSCKFVGNTFKGYINGKNVISCQLPTYKNNGLLGLMYYGGIATTNLVPIEFYDLSYKEYMFNSINTNINKVLC